MWSNREPLLIRYCPWLLTIGFTLLALWRFTGISAFMSGIPLLFTGAVGGALYRYRTERGLWMLSTLIAVMIGLFFGVAVIGITKDILHLGMHAKEVRSELIWGVVSAAAITYLVADLYKVTAENWKFSKRSPY